MPALLVISLLAPITLSLQLLPARPDQPHFSAWFAPLRLTRWRWQPHAAAALWALA